MTIRVPFLDLRIVHAELKEELEEACRRVMRSGHYVLGPEVEAFEAEFAAYCGARFCIGVGNGLDSLRLILEAYGVGEGDEVIVPAQTFIATWLAVSAVGAKPVPGDVRPDTGNLDASAIAGSITPRTRAIVAVHLFGHPADMKEIRKVADAHGLSLIEDAAQAHGATYRGKKAGALSDAAGFSFYPAKNLGAIGDGGAVVTNDEAIAKRVRLLRNYGSAHKYQHDMKGYNSRLDELQAAFLREKLKKLEDHNRQRRAVAERYLEGLKDVDSLIMPGEGMGSQSAWHLFVIRYRDRDPLMRHLEQRGIQTMIHYPTPPFLAPAYAKEGWAAKDYPVAWRFAQTSLSLPLNPHLGETEQEWVMDAVRRFFGAPGDRQEVGGASPLR